MSVSKAKRWQRYGYLGTTHFPQSTLDQISRDPEMSPETQNMASEIRAKMISLRINLSRDLKAMDERNRRKKNDPRSSRQNA